MQSRLLLVAACVTLAMSTAGTARADKTVWSGLVIAENVAQPEPIPPELARLEQTLKELFGYNQFQVIGQSRKTLKTGEEDWLASSKYFSLHVDSRGETEAGYVVNLKLYKEKEILLETDTKLSERSPLVIKGPQVGGGQLLLVLVVNDDERKNPPGELQRNQHHAKDEPNKLVAALRRLSRMIRDSMP